MRNSPFAMLITPIWPKVSVRPRAARKRMAPVAVPVRKGVVSASIATLSEIGARVPRALGARHPQGRVRGRVSALGRVPPVVTLEEGIGLDRLLRAPDHVELV